MPPLLPLLLLTLAAPDFVVAPAGNDAGPGTAAAPFATVARAKAAAAQRIAAGLTADLTIELRAGVYELAAPLVFGPGDGGTAQHKVVYTAAPGAVVTLSGGQRLGGWTKGEGGVWTAKAPAGAAFRQLVVDGKLATRARHPATGWLRVQRAELTADRARYTLSLPAGQVKPWANLGDVEVVVLGNWEITRKKLAAVDAATGLVTLAPPHAGGHDAIRPGPGRPCYFENAREFLDQPGEWYLDRAAGVVHYLPREGEDLAKAEVVAPRLTRLVEVVGTPEQPVRNLHLRGLRLAHCDWAFPAYGFNGVQASWHTWPKEGQKGWDWHPWRCIEPAVYWTWCEGCSLTDGALEFLGGVGLRLDKGCHGATIEGNLVREIGASGIMVGAAEWSEKDPPGEVPRNVRVANNHVTRCGLLDFGAVGIWGSFCDGLVIAHNEVHALPYSGISLGWRWNPTPTGARNNRIEFNHSWDTMNVLCDGGCLYTLGFQPGSVVRGNHFHDARRSEFAQGAPNNGIFFDEGTKGFHVEQNLIHGNSAGPIRFNQTGRTNLTWGENWLDAPRSVPGKVGLALACDGAGGVTAPHDAQLDPPELTAEAWIKVAALPTQGDNRRWIVNKNGNEWQDGHWALMLQGDRCGAYLNIGGGQGNMLDAWSPAGAVRPDAWHHLAFTYDGRDLRVYLDGQPAATRKIDKPRRPGRGGLAIGKREDDHSHFRGAIDEVFVYNRALTPAEVTARAKGEAVAGAVAEWRFEQSQALSAALEAVRAQAGLEPPYRERLLGPQR